LTPNPQILELTPPEIANRIQAFYDSRRSLHNWENIRALQTAYFALTPPARRAFAAEHPELRRYWDWRRDFLYRNPDLIPFLTENPEDFQYPSAQMYEEAMAGQPHLVAAEWYQVLGPSLYAIMDDYQYGEELPEAATASLEQIAEQYGTTLDHILSDVAQALAQP
jgi:hypothetical protein